MFAVSVSELGRREVEWYRHHGKHPERRIARSEWGREFVLDDTTWNENPDNPKECIEDAMLRDLGWGRL